MQDIAEALDLRLRMVNMGHTETTSYNSSARLEFQLLVREIRL